MVNTETMSCLRDSVSMKKSARPSLKSGHHDRMLKAGIRLRHRKQFVPVVGGSAFKKVCNICRCGIDISRARSTSSAKVRIRHFRSDGSVRIPTRNLLAGSALDRPFVAVGSSAYTAGRSQGRTITTRHQ